MSNVETSTKKQKKRKLITPRRVLSVITLILVAFVVYQARDEIFQAFDYLGNTNLWFILLLIPEQLLMYYCVGQMFFSYLTAKKNAPHVSPWDLMRISFELNFVNHAIPSGGVAGLGYISWRLKQFGSSVGQTSFMYILRYAITICANQLQVFLAVILLIAIGGIASGAWWIVWLALAISVGIVAILTIIVIIASNRKRIDWFVRIATKTLNTIVRTATFGHKRQALEYRVVETFFVDMHKNLLTARRNKRLLVRPILWGLLYSFLEVATYWLVGASMGHPEIILPFMVAEAIASAVGAVIPLPGGVGGYEGAMIFFVTALGVDLGLATAIVITTRVVILFGTIISGYGFYQHAISKLGKKDKKEIEQINERPL